MLGLSLFLTACGREPEPTTAPTVPGTESTGVTDPSTEPTAPSTEPSEVIGADCHTPNWTPEQYDFYLNHVSDAPAGFVHYEHIRWMGEVQWIHIPRSFEHMENMENSWFYSYYMQDEAGFNLELRVGRAYPGYTSTVPETNAINPEDMRFLTEEIEGRVRYIYGDMSYSYEDGRLMYIKVEWENGKSCVLSSGILTTDELCDYPTEPTGTFLGDLLSLETADEAVERFLAAINAPIPET